MEKLKKTIIGIDASRSSVKQKTGTEYYSYELIRNMVKETDVDFKLYSKEKLDYVQKQENIEFKVMKFPRLWSQVRLSLEILSNPPAVLFEPAHTIPLIHGKKTVVTLHDIGFKYFPELYTPLERIYHDICMRFSVKHATRIIAISDATKDDLIKIYKADPKKIEVIYHGYDKDKYSPGNKREDKSEHIKKLGEYIFFIGRLEAKKNVKNLIKSYGILRQNPKISHKLVLAGRPGFMYEEIKETINGLPKNIRADVIELGYVDDTRVSELMRSASVFFFPSYFEGFGMPLLEAMASGIPVVASNTTSIPEIVKDAGLLSDPDDPSTFAKNISIMILDKKTRDHYIERGLDRSKEFSWEKCSRETLDLIESVAKSN